MLIAYHLSFRFAATVPRPSGRRSQSDDSAGKPHSGKKSHNKKSSQHADVIDRLDYTGVGPSMTSTLLNSILTYQNLVFHHDGPFDACAPSRNKHHNKAPLHAWTLSDESSPLQYGDAAYPSIDAYRAFSNDYTEPPKKKVDAIAEAWGIHEPEPFEEFFAGGGSGKPDDTPANSIYNGKDSHNSYSTPHARRAKDGPDARDRIARRSIAPAPQPIFVAEPSDIEPESLPTPTGLPKRSKSLMHRIRKMRDAPNIPVGLDYHLPPSPPAPTPSSPTSLRPTHRSQNSFLGRFGGTSRANQSPGMEKPEPYVFIDAQTQTNKELPVLPTSTSAPDEDIPFQHYPETQMAAPSSPPGERFGRKASIMKKVGRVVRGAK